MPTIQQPRFWTSGLALTLSTCWAGVAAGEVRLLSPSGEVSALVDVVGERLTIEVERRGEPALERSPLGVTVDGIDLGQDVELGKPKPYTVDDRYPFNGHASELRDHAHGLRVPVRRGQGTWTLELRAYDDGVAWRYVVPGAGQRRVTGEATAFDLPDNATFWSHRNTKSYEAQYERFEVATGPSDRSFTMPLTVELAGGGYACLAEADVMHYSGMTLRPADGLLHAAFEDDHEGWTMDGSFATPWRICIAVEDLDGLVNSSIIYNVSPSPDLNLFPQGSKTPWIQPGRSLWQWWYYSWDGMDWDKQFAFVDRAADLGCDYYLVDEGWESAKRGWVAEGRNEWQSLAELVRYARGKGVKIWVWRNWDRLKSNEEKNTFFRRLAEAGAVGAKIDFMESESQERLKFYRDCLEIAARHKIMINFHGANKSAGETRTWPNEMSREGVFGLEQNKGGPAIQLRHYTALPFTAFIGGPKDFTPTTFSQTNSATTPAFQLATAVLYTSPFLCWADRAERYLQTPAVELMRHVPATWDRTIVLPESKIGEFVAMARQKDGEWWVAVTNGTKEAKSYQLSLSFLGEGRWQSQSLVDVAGEPAGMQLLDAAASAGDTLDVSLEPAGGFVARLVRSKVD